jgi:hypothetical protein
VQDTQVLSEAAMSKIGGSGIARKEIKNPIRFPLSFDWRVVLPLAVLGFTLTLHLILPAHADYGLKPLPYFAGFLKILLAIYGIAAIASVFSSRMGNTIRMVPGAASKAFAPENHKKFLWRNLCQLKQIGFGLS